MLFVLNILLALAGAYALIDGRLPEKGFSIAFGRGSYETSQRNARLFGAWLVLPLVLEFVSANVIGMFINPMWIGAFHICVFIVDAVVAISWARGIRDSNKSNNKLKREPKPKPETFVPARSPLWDADDENKPDISPLLDENLINPSRRKRKGPQPHNSDPLP